MEETCIHEYIYWAEFQSKRFYQILPEGFDLHLSIPSKFAENVKELCGTVDLKGPARKIWKVELNKNQDGLFFQNGWSQFVRDNCLKTGNLLVFIYNGHLHFDVSIFDHESSCEKACSFFVENRDCRVGSTKRSREDYEGVSPSAPHSPTVEPPSKKKHRSDRVNKALILSKAPVAAKERRSRRSTKSLFATREFRSEELESSDYSDDGVTSGDETGGGTTPLGLKRTVREHKSDRRPATEEEKKKVRQLADTAFAANPDKNFFIIMRDSHVYRGFQLTIPSDFAMKHFPPENKNCILCCEGRNRTVMFKPRQNLAGAKFSGTGWADFVLENNIDKDDICLFELVQPALQKQEEQDMIFNVRVFRAVEEIIVPLTCHRTLWQSSGGGRKTQTVGASGRGRGRGRGPRRGRGRRSRLLT